MLIAMADPTEADLRRARKLIFDDEHFPIAPGDHGPFQVSIWQIAKAFAQMRDEMVKAVAGNA